MNQRLHLHCTAHNTVQVSVLYYQAYLRELAPVGACRPRLESERLEPPSKKALKRECERLRQMAGKEMCFKPLPEMVAELNQHLQGWSNYFSFVYPRAAFREINSYVRYRLDCHLRRRSQWPCRPPEGTTLYRYLKQMGESKGHVPPSLFRVLRGRQGK